jgi:hypothetical protein
VGHDRVFGERAYIRTSQARCRIITKEAGNVSMSRFVKSNGDQYRQQPD